jgi:hypothetical protein
MTISGTSFASHLNGMGVPQLMRREPAPHSRRGCGAPQLGACRGRRPVPTARGAVDDAQQRTNRELAPRVKPGLKLFPSPCVHADFAAAPALAAPNNQ